MPTIKVDGQELEVKEGVNLLDALLSAGIDVPYFCWHPSMGSIGACRQCAVIQYADEEDTRGRIVMSCMTPVTDNAVFSVDAENAATFRDSVIENLMLNHPHDCPVCEEGGECHLQDMTVMAGHRNRQYEGRKTTYPNQYLGPFIGHEMNRCISCYRCVRYYRDYSGGHDLSAFASRSRVFFGRAADGVLENEFAGNLVEVCPTGVFTDKTLSKHYTRKWDLQSAPTVCQGCSLGCNTYTSERYGEIRRVHNRYHQDVNGYFLCDRGRFGAGFVASSKRIPQSGIRNDQGLYDAVSLDTAITKIQAIISEGTKVVGIGSARASLESNFALRQFVGQENFCNGMTEIDQEMHGIIIDVLQSKLTTPSLTEVEEYDAVLILGEDVTNHAPRLALSVRQATRNLASEMAGNTQIPQWHDAAVRVLAQNHRSPLIVVTPTEDRLDEVASSSMRLMPRDIAELGYALAEEIAGNTTSSTPDVEAIARTLLEAKKPLVISGSSSQSPDILKAAVNLSLALKDRNDRAGIFLCANECNSVGVAMIDNERSISELLSTSPSVVVVLENDLSIRLGQQFSSSISSVNNLIAIDHLDNSTTSASSVVLPAATFAEAEGTLVNSEGRAQRSMAVYKAQDEIKAGYHLIDALAGNERSSTEVRSELSEQIPALAGILKAAPESDFRFEGAKFPRMTHRSSGRTAMRADISVHEPKQPVDEESALSFSMEGNQQQAPASLRAYTWSPGWNSNQSVHKFQSEVGGEYVGGDSGYLLFRESVDIEPFSKSTQAYSALIPRYHIFGSDELSAESEELSTLIPRPYLRINNTTAKNLKVEQGDGLMCTINNGNLQFAVIVDEAIPDNTFVYPIIPETRGMNGISSTDFSRVDDWVQDMDPLSPKTITTDRSS